jgi:hypothetical protein
MPLKSSSTSSEATLWFLVASPQLNTRFVGAIKTQFVPILVRKLRGCNRKMPNVREEEALRVIAQMRLWLVLQLILTTHRKSLCIKAAKSALRSSLSSPFAQHRVENQNFAAAGGVDATCHDWIGASAEAPRASCARTHPDKFNCPRPSSVHIAT